MPHYRRSLEAGATYFFTVNLADRRSGARLGRCPSQCEHSEPGLGDLSKPTALT